MIDILEKISAVIPTFNRHRFALRAANYYRNIGVKTIIADGTLNQNSGLDKLSRSCENVTYYHLPGQSWSERMRKNMCSVDTKYVVISADDEFHLQSGLITSLELLEKDVNAACAVGRSAKFNYTNGNVSLGEAYNYIKSFSHENPIERTAQLLQNYSPFPCYSVWRADYLKSIFEILCKTEWSSWRVDEVIHVAGAGLLGNCLVHEELQWLRSNENPPSNTPAKKQIPFYEWYLEKSLKHEHANFCRILASFMTNQHFRTYSDSEKEKIGGYLLDKILSHRRFSLMRRKMAWNFFQVNIHPTRSETLKVLAKYWLTLMIIRSTWIALDSCKWTGHLDRRR